MKDMYAIIGIGKLKAAGNIAGVLSHMMRTRETPNSDGRENTVLIQPPSLSEVMQEIALYMPRKNAVLAYDMLLTASPEFFQDKTPEQVQEWAQDALAWACKKLDRENIKGAVLHLDENTGPHVQILALPVVNSKLNARGITGGRERMRALWTEYAAAMKHWGLVRGREYSPAKHVDVKDYYQAVNRATELAKVRAVKPEELPAPELLDRVSPRQYAADLINRVTEFIRRENSALRVELAREKRQRESLTRQMISERELFHALKENPELFRQLERELTAERQGRNEDRRRYMELAAAIKTFFRKNIPKNSKLRHPDQLGNLQSFPEIRKDVLITLVQNGKERQEMERGK